MKDAQPKISRRRFLFAAGAGSAATAAALIPKTETQPAATSSSTTEPQSGYQLTEHVRKYYRTTRT